MRGIGAAIVPAAALAALLATAGDAAAQAWVPSKGEGAVAIAFQNLAVKEHILTTTRVDVGHIDTYVLLTDVTYGLSNKVAVDFSLPYVASRYTGDRPHPTALDDGKYHQTFTDFRFALRYNLTRRGTVLTPYIGTTVPSHGYEYFAHSAPGEQLRELQVGTFVAKMFDRGLPGAFVSGRVAYGFAEKVLDISHNRTMADVELGYFLSSSLRAFGMFSGQYTHGGIDLPPVGGLAALPALYRGVHDQIDRAHHVNLGGGAAYSISDSMDVFGSFVATATGRNEHALQRGITIGASWSFGRQSAVSRITSSAPGTVTAKRQASLTKCICQKSGA